MTVVTNILDARMDYGPAPEATAPRRDAWLDAARRPLRPFHRRQLGVAARGGRPSTRIEPGDRQAAGARSRKAGAADVDAAVAAARKALPSWAALAGHERARHLYAHRRAMLQQHERLFAVLETLDNGKPIRESRDIDVPLVARHFYHHAGWAQLHRERVPRLQRRSASCGQIIPWNFPLLMLAWKIAPALAAGNTVVLKPAEFTPLTALAVRRDLRARPACRRASSTSSPATARPARRIVEHAGVDKIAFTGSTEVGRIIRKATAGTGKKLSLELGGKSPFIVFDDADLDSAVEGRGRRDLVQPGPGLLRRLAPARAGRHRRRLHRQGSSARMATLRVGDPLDKAIDIGADRRAGAARAHPRRWSPRASRRARRCWQPDVRAARRAAASIRRRWSPASRRPSTVAQEEIFGPVLVAMTFRTPDEAVALANNTRYGLAASRVDREHQPRARRRAAAQGRRGLDQLAPTCSTPPPASAAIARAASAARAGARACYEYLKPQGAGRSAGDQAAPQRRADAAEPARRLGTPSIDRTAKLYIGGKQARPDGDYSLRRARPQGQARRRGRRRQPQGHPQRRRGRARLPGWARGDRAQPRAGALLHRREPVGARATSSPPHLAAHDRRRRQGGARRGRRVDRAAVQLRRPGPTSTRARCTSRRCAASRWR